MKEEKVILVNVKDEETGIAEKMHAHRQGLLHRAFSVFIFNNRNELLIQQRSVHKYHSGGLWTNTCCSHPRPGETIREAAVRRLGEEMGISADLEEIFGFIYRTDFENGLIEHEFDHVLAGDYEGELNINNEEVMDYSFVSMDQIENSLATHPEKYTVWFRLAFPRVKKWVSENKKLQTAKS